MADNVPITAGTGTSVATDDVGGDHYQRVKLDGGGDGVAAPILGNSANGLDVDVTRISDATASGSLVNTNDAVTITLSGHSQVAFQVTGTFSGTFRGEVTVDGSTWVPIRTSRIPEAGSVFETGSVNQTLTGIFLHPVTGFASFRVFAAGMASGTAVVTVRAANGAVGQLLTTSTNNTPLVSLANSAGTAFSSAGLSTDANSVGTSLVTAAYALGYNGTNWDRLRSDTTNGLDVDVTRVPTDPFGANADAASATGSISAKLRFIAATGIPITGSVTVGSHAVTNTGTFAVQAASTGDVAHDGINSGNPVQIGVEAIAHGTNPTAVAAADRTKLYANRAGIPFVIGGHPNVVTVKHTTITTAVTDAPIITVATGLKIVVTAFTITLDNASTVFPTVLMGFGTANTPTTTGVIAAHGGVPAGGGFSRGDGSGILGIGADDADLRITTTGNATGNGLQVVVTYYTIES